MKKAITVVTLMVLGAVALVMPSQASAGSSTDAALALGAFAVFNQIFGGYGAPHVVRETVVVQQPAVIYVPPPPPPPAVIYAPPPVVVYPSGYAYSARGYYYRPYRTYHHEHDDD